jgi:hypothetical protein
MVLLIGLREYMSIARRKKTKHIDTDVAEQEEERETGDIYDDKQRGEMQGREMKPEKRKRPTHKDTVSVELAGNEYEED